MDGTQRRSLAAFLLIAESSSGQSRRLELGALRSSRPFGGKCSGNVVPLHCCINVGTAPSAGEVMADRKQLYDDVDEGEIIEHGQVEDPKVKPITQEPVKSQNKWFRLGKKQLKYITIISGKTLNSHKDFKRRLQNKVSGLLEVSEEEKYDMILLFCPIVSRAGTDIGAALEKLHNIPGSLPVILVVLHHTLEADCTILDSSMSVTRQNTLTVDCQFHEDKGLLESKKNDDAIQSIVTWIEQPAKIVRWNHCFMCCLSADPAE
ncbi:hypothetical protein AOLI_G00269940 [Acnodon oligacanthus]